VRRENLCILTSELMGGSGPTVALKEPAQERWFLMKREHRLILIGQSRPCDPPSPGVQSRYLMQVFEWGSRATATSILRTGVFIGNITPSLPLYPHVTVANHYN
jgi:hypothetical protein